MKNKGLSKHNFITKSWAIVKKFIQELIKSELPDPLEFLYDIADNKHKIQVVEEIIADSIKSMFQVVESDCDEDTYLRVKKAIDNFKNTIIDFIKSQVNVTWEEINYNLYNEIQGIENLDYDKKLNIIQYGSNCLEKIKQFADEQSLSEKITFNNSLSNINKVSTQRYFEYSKTYVEQLKDKTIYVPNIYKQFLKKIKEVRFLIIEGPAGIGKTTLSEWIILQLCIDKPNIVILNTTFENLETIIDQMRKVISIDTPVIIYLNDFFGSNFLAVDPSKANELLKKLEINVKTFQNLFVLVTSRDNVEKMAMESIKKDDLKILQNYTHELSTKSFSDEEKIQFMVENSKSKFTIQDLKPSNILDTFLLKGKFIPEVDIIIKRFNPRLILRALDTIEGGESKDEKINILTKSLLNPIDLYMEELELLSEEAKILLFNLFFIIPYKTFKSIDRKKFILSLNKIELKKDINNILLELKQWIDVSNEIKFKDPGILDFLAKYLDSPDINSQMAISKIETGYYYFRQLYNIKKSEGCIDQLFREKFEDEGEFSGNKLLYLINQDKELDVKIFSELIKSTKSSFYVFETIESKNNIVEPRLASFEELIEKSLTVPNHTEVFEFLFLEKDMNWSSRVEDFYEFEEIIIIFNAYLSRDYKGEATDFIENFQDSLHYFLECYVKSTQNEIDSEFSYYLPLEEVEEEMFDSLNYENKKFYFRKFADKVRPRVQDMVNQELEKKPLSDFLLKHDFNFDAVIEQLVTRLEEEGVLYLYQVQPENMADIKSFSFDYYETGIETEVVGRYEIVYD